MKIIELTLILVKNTMRYLTLFYCKACNGLHTYTYYVCLLAHTLLLICMHMYICIYI